MLEPALYQAGDVDSKAWLLLPLAPGVQGGVMAENPAGHHSNLCSAAMGIRSSGEGVEGGKAFLRADL